MNGLTGQATKCILNEYENEPVGFLKPHTIWTGIFHRSRKSTVSTDEEILMNQPSLTLSSDERHSLSKKNTGDAIHSGL